MAAKSTKTTPNRRARKNAPVKDAPVQEPKVDAAPVSEDTSSPVETPAERKPRQPGLTLSQRRALLRLADGRETGDAVTVASDFRALPMRYLVECGYAVETTPLSFELTEVGIERAERVNPGYRAWAAGESVAADPARPVAGEHRALPKAERHTRQAWIAHS